MLICRPLEVEKLDKQTTLRNPPKKIERRTSEVKTVVVAVNICEVSPLVNMP
jgi:hypothetical protein